MGSPGGGGGFGFSTFSTGFVSIHDGPADGGGQGSSPVDLWMEDYIGPSEPVAGECAAVLGRVRDAEDVLSDLAFDELCRIGRPLIRGVGHGGMFRPRLRPSCLVGRMSPGKRIGLSRFVRGGRPRRIRRVGPPGGRRSRGPLEDKIKPKTVSFWVLSSRMRRMSSDESGRRPYDARSPCWRARSRSTLACRRRRRSSRSAA